MAQTTRTSARTAGRFGRTSAGASAGRFSRPGSTPTRGRRTPARATPRVPSRLSRGTGSKSKQQKGIGGLLAGLKSTGAASKATPSSKTGKAGGLAALAAAAGVAFKNRDKLSAMVDRKRGDQPDEAPLNTPNSVPRTDFTTPPPSGA